MKEMSIGVRIASEFGYTKGFLSVQMFDPDISGSSIQIDLTNSKSEFVLRPELKARLNDAELELNEEETVKGKLHYYCLSIGDQCLYLGYGQTEEEAEQLGRDTFKKIKRIINKTKLEQF